MKFANPERVMHTHFGVCDRTAGGAGEIHGTMFIGTTMALIAGGLAAAGAVAKGVGAAKAAGAQANAARNAQNMQMTMDARNQGQLAPYLNEGTQAMDRLNYLMGLAPASTAALDTTKTRLSGMTPGQALSYAQTGGDPNVSSSREMTQGWIDSGTPFDVVNGVAVKRAASGAPAGVDPHDYGSLMKDFTGQDLQSEPGYQFGLTEGNKAIARAAAAKGASFGGSTLKAMDKFATDYAGTKYNDAFNRYNSNRSFKLGSLMGLIGVGENATGQSVNSTHQTANAVNEDMLQLGNAQAAGDVGVAGAINGGLNGIMNSYLLTQVPNSTTGTTSGMPTGGTPPFIDPGYYNPSMRNGTYFNSTDGRSPLLDLHLN